MALAEVGPERGAVERVPAYEDWYREHHARLRNRCARLLGDDAAADDVAQETLLRAWQHRDRLDPERGIYPWLCTVSQRLCVDLLRSRRLLVRLDDLAETADERPGPATAAEAAVDRDAVRRAMRALPDRQRRALYLREIEDVSYDELAGRFDCTVGGARILLFRARAGLRSHLDGMAGSLVAVLGICRQRARRAGVRVAERLAPHEWTLQGSTMAAAPAVAALAVTSMIVVAPDGDASRPATVHAVAEPAAARPAPTSSPEGLPVDSTSTTSIASGTEPASGTAATTPVHRDDAAPAPPAVGVDVDVDMGPDAARVSGAAPAPGGGDPVPFGAELTRVSDGSDSVVLHTTDDLAAASCGLLRGICDRPAAGEEAP